jgi:hypothetical protein
VKITRGLGWINFGFILELQIAWVLKNLILVPIEEIKKILKIDRI